MVGQARVKEGVEVRRQIHPGEGTTVKKGENAKDEDGPHRPGKITGVSEGMVQERGGPG